MDSQKQTDKTPAFTTLLLLVAGVILLLIMLFRDLKTKKLW